MNVIKKYYKNQMIKNKFILIYVPLVIIPLIILGYFSNMIYTNSITKKTVENVLDNSKLIIAEVDNVISNAEGCSKIITISINNVIHEIIQQKTNQITELNYKNRIRNQLGFALMFFSDIEAAIFIDMNSQVIGTDMKIENDIKNLDELDIIEVLRETSGKSMWFPMEKRNLMVSDENNPVLSLGKKIIDINSGETLGFLLLNIKESTFSDMFNELGPVKQSTYSIIDNEGTIISASNYEKLLKPIDNKGIKEWVLSENKGYEIKKIDNKKILLTSADYEKFRWTLLSQIPLKALTADIDKITLIIILISFLCLILALVGAGTVTVFIVEPIIQLKNNMMKMREGNLENYCEVKSVDEIGQLAYGFNSMIDRIKELLSNIKYEQKKKREYELALIQAQIKPHFLYNTLDLIYVLTEMERNQEASKVTKALADFYRVILSKGREIIPLNEEIKSIIDYLNIQKLRYSDIFDFDIEIEDSIKTCKILKLTIQPLVENAIYHGLKQKGSFGRIRIKAIKKGELVLIKVSDDGVGIQEHKLQQILSAVPRESDKAYFGLSNVNERLKLYFGNSYGLRIKSKVNVGTEVAITIPYVNRSEGVDV